MKREILVNATPRETRVAILEDGQLVELLVDRPDARRMVGDVYLGKVEAVLPGIQAAFVNIGTEKSAFLHAADVVVEDAPVADDEDDDEDEAGDDAGGSAGGGRRQAGDHTIDLRSEFPRRSRPGAAGLEQRLCCVAIEIVHHHLEARTAQARRKVFAEVAKTDVCKLHG